LYLEVFRAFKFLSDKSQQANGIDVLGELEKLGATLAYERNQASSREIDFDIQNNIGMYTTCSPHVLQK